MEEEGVDLLRLYSNSTLPKGIIQEIETKTIPLITQIYGEKYMYKISELVPQTLAPKSNFQYAKLSPFPDFNSLSLPMESQIERNIGADCVKTLRRKWIN